MKHHLMLTAALSVAAVFATTAPTQAQIGFLRLGLNSPSMIRGTIHFPPKGPYGELSPESEVKVTLWEAHPVTPPAATNSNGPVFAFPQYHLTPIGTRLIKVGKGESSFAFSQRPSVRRLPGTSPPFIERVEVPLAQGLYMLTAEFHGSLPHAPSRTVRAAAEWERVDEAFVLPPATALTRDFRLTVNLL